MALPNFFFVSSSLLSYTFVLSSSPTDLHDIHIVILSQYLFRVHTSFFFCSSSYPFKYPSYSRNIISNHTRPKPILHRQNYHSGFLLNNSISSKGMKLCPRRKTIFLSPAEMTRLCPPTLPPLFPPSNSSPSPGPLRSFQILSFNPFDSSKISISTSFCPQLQQQQQN